MIKRQDGLLAVCSVFWLLAASPAAAAEARVSGMQSPPGWTLPADTSAVGIEDLYKLLHQAYRGPGHAVVSREAAELYLRQEWTGLDSVLTGEPLLEVLVPDAPFVRLNLRPFRERGGSIDSLLDAFVRSAAAPTDSAMFIRAWEGVADSVSRGKLPWGIDEYRMLDAEARPRGYPAIHHSRSYLDRFRPAYRVLHRMEAERVLASLRGGGGGAR